MEKDKKEFMTVKEVAVWTGVEILTVYRWASKGRLKQYRTPGGQLRFHRQDVIRAREVSAESDGKNHDPMMG